MGLSIAVLLSQHHKVTAVDVVPEKVEMINHRKSPIQDEYIEKYLAEKKTEGIQAEKLAYIFHQKLADLITDGCRKIRKKTKCNCVALSGGVFQNRLLLRMVEEGLEKEHFTVLRHHLIPANDGGIALGQAAYAMQYIQEGK